MPDRFLQKAEEKLRAARVLFENGLYEDAVGRAYYCMYFATKAIFLTRNIDAKTHKGLLVKFGLEFVNEGLIEEYYGKALRMAKEMREEADYGVMRNISKEEAESLISDSERFLEKIDGMIDEMCRKK